MSSPQQIFDETYLATRAKLIELAATFDRIDRAGGGKPVDDPRRARLEEALQVLLAQSDSADRAKQLQQIFSRPYDDQWRREFGIQ
ncbi:MAG: hypothetical protein ACO1RT_06040 [Planctomycetaceae bacterium]